MEREEDRQADRKRKKEEKGKRKEPVSEQHETKMQREQRR